MTDSADVEHPSEGDFGCGLIMIASGVAAALITAGLGWAFALPLVFLVVLLLGIVIGLPLYLAACRLRLVNAATAAAAGFIAGALLPALGLLLTVEQVWEEQSAAGWWEAVAPILLFGGAGIAGGLVFWVGLTWSQRTLPRPLEKIGLGNPRIAAALTIAAIVAVPLAVAEIL